MGREILKAGGVVLPAPVSITVNDEIIWSADTGRTMSGQMVGEAVAEKKLLSMLPPDLRPDFEDAVTIPDPEVRAIVKAADKLSAYLKCVEELKAGNAEFKKAAEQTMASLKAMDMEELDWFMERFLPAFSLTLDELQ